MPDKITTEYMEPEEKESITYAQAVRRTVTMYPEQWAIVDALARKRHRGKTSAALQDIVNRFLFHLEGGAEL